MMEFRHFILVIVKLDCLVANDGNVCCAASTTVILHSVSLKCISLSGILHYEYCWEKKRGEFNLFIHLSSKLMEKLYNHINFFLLSQAIVTLRSLWQHVGTAKAETMTLTGSRPILKRNPHQIYGCPQVRTAESAHLT